MPRLQAFKYELIPAGEQQRQMRRFAGACRFVFNQALAFGLPGRNVCAKAGLNKAILDQGWFEFRRQLDCKLAWNGGHLIAVPPQNTSRTYPCCGHVSAENRRTQARFECVACGFEENADLVGAINVLRAGHARLACAETSPEVGALGQEPTEATHSGSMPGCAP